MQELLHQLLRIPISKQILLDKNFKGAKIKVRSIDGKIAIKFKYSNGNESTIKDLSTERIST